MDGAGGSLVTPDRSYASRRIVFRSASAPKARRGMAANCRIIVIMSNVFRGRRIAIDQSVVRDTWFWGPGKILERVTPPFRGRGNLPELGPDELWVAWAVSPGDVRLEPASGPWMTAVRGVPPPRTSLPFLGPHESQAPIRPRNRGNCTPPVADAPLAAPTEQPGWRTTIAVVFPQPSAFPSPAAAPPRSPARSALPAWA